MGKLTVWELISEAPFRIIMFLVLRDQKITCFCIFINHCCLISEVPLTFEETREMLACILF